MKTIKGQPIQAWKDWIEYELTPPIQVSEEIQYLIEAFKEAIELIESNDENINCS